MNSRRRHNRHVIYLYLTVLRPGLMGGWEGGVANDHAAGIIEPLLERLRIEDGGLYVLCVSAPYRIRKWKGGDRDSYHRFNRGVKWLENQIEAEWEQLRLDVRLPQKV